MSETLLCIGTSLSPIYDGNDFTNGIEGSIALEVLAYQMNLSQENASFSEKNIRVTTRNPSQLPALLNAMSGNETISFRLVVRGPDLNGQISVLNEFSASAVISQLIPHRPNISSPVNSNFSNMTDITLNISGTLNIKESYTSFEEASYNFNGGGS